ncbi:RAMP superfamily CRISPR-associated protein [Selenomonas ruminis]|uniref:CRISPR type III-associated protein domain-containing protein n=1 Tax=Selenomonas ruminis TaxID=2593411 RepID=A0A5D6W683_9FIRM|nr:RAMP superfamily CRISPR-associated protein [Selenomonas sp. mPRGC5]TYZ22932.1 hypothetical protein FZ040_06855 [Selenomonas sp. mPRGC5]
MKLNFSVEVLSPIHLGSGQADVNVDAEVIHDAYGMPYFPARRLKGLLYESAVEVCEMGQLSKITALTNMPLDGLFHHEENESHVQLIVPNLYLHDKAGYPALQTAWKALQAKYKEFLQPADVLQQYTSLRYQTKLENGVAFKGSLHNMRVVKAGVKFSGVIGLEGEEAEKYLVLLAAACCNLRTAGLKRNRGFGRIRCDFQEAGNEKRTARSILKEVQAG